MKKTPAGRRCLSGSYLAADAAIEAASSSLGRQLVIDIASHFVKCGEAAATPETKAALDSAVVVFCRMTDFLSSNRAKEAYHCTADFIWQVINLASDADAANTMAGVVANICHALEMEAE